MPMKARNQGQKELDTNPHQDNLTMPQALQIQDAKAAVKKKEKIPAWKLGKSETRKMWSMKPEIRAEKFILCGQEDGCVSEVGNREGPDLRLCKHQLNLGGTRRGGKDELTSCRGTVQSAWQKTSSESHRRKNRAARKCKWSPRGTGTTVLTNPCPSQP